jgi:hypothetical protein
MQRCLRCGQSSQISHEEYEVFNKLDYFVDQSVGSIILMGGSENSHYVSKDEIDVDQFISFLKDILMNYQSGGVLWNYEEEHCNKHDLYVGIIYKAVMTKGNVSILFAFSHFYQSEGALYYINASRVASRA